MSRGDWEKYNPRAPRGTARERSFVIERRGRKVIHLRGVWRLGILGTNTLSSFLENG